MSDTGSIATLAELRSFLQSRYQGVESFGADLMRFTVTGEAGAIGVGVHCPDPWDGKRWVAFSIKLCPVDALQPRGATLANTQLPVGAIALLKDWAVLRQTLPLDGLDAQLIEQTLAGLTDTAARLKVAHAGTGEEDLGYLFR